jgi:hypothetical protein
MILEFTGTGVDFSACNDAENYCRTQGISVGAMQGPEPRGLLWGDVRIAKWRNLSESERQALNGKMTGSMRHGPVTVQMWNDKPE